MSPEQMKLIATDFHSFARKVFRFMESNKLGNELYIYLLCSEIEKLARGETRRLLINLPPRHLKTFLGTICLAAWTLAQDPSARIIIVTYNDELAKDMSRDIRKILRSAWFMKIFRVRLADDHAKVGNFKTTKNGGVYAVSDAGAIGGRGAELIIYDDPVALQDWNNESVHQQVIDGFEGILMSRFNTAKKGRVVVIGHRLAEQDLSAHLIEQGGWRRITLPFIATRTREYDLGFKVWRRKKGTLLRPDAYTASDVRRRQSGQWSPPFYFYYQQGRGTESKLAIRPEHFRSFAPHMWPIAPVVLSVDAAQKAGPTSSYNVIQAWACNGRDHFLLYQWRERGSFIELRDKYYFFVRKFRPSAAVIEDTANGSALIAQARRKGSVQIVAVTPGRPKGERLLRHAKTIRSGHIHLPEDAIWRGDFCTELASAPNGEWTDQGDALTNYLDFMATNPPLQMPVKRALGVVYGSRGPITPIPLPASTGRFGSMAVALNSRWPWR